MISPARRLRWLNYLRVRGEYLALTHINHTMMELPPRARRIQYRAPGDAKPDGTTSACAENTSRACERLRREWNYLRVRGEYMRVADGCITTRELPPRARRIRLFAQGAACSIGTTSACAENTEA